MPAEDDIRRQIDLKLFDEKEVAKLAELAEDYERNRNQIPMVLGGSGPVRDIIQEMLEMEIPDEWKERYSLPPDKKTQAEVSTTLDSPPARQNWLDTEPDLELVEQVPTEEREQWREMEAAAIDRRLADMDKNWMEVVQLCGLDAEPVAVRIFRDEKLLPALDRWEPVIGSKHYKRLSTKWTARLNAREMELRYKEGPAAEPEQVRGSPQSSGAVEAQTLVVGHGNTRKPRNVHHDPLKALIGTTKRDHPGISHRDLCRGLDVKRPELPRGSTWQKKSGERSWIGNYDCTAVHPLIDTYLSKIPPASPKRKNTK